MTWLYGGFSVRERTHEALVDNRRKRRATIEGPYNFYIMICIASWCTFSPINLLASHSLKSISCHCNALRAYFIRDARVGGP